MATKRKTHDAKSRILLEKVWKELGENRVEERWIRDRHGWLGYQEPGRVVVSPLNMVGTLLHELLHAAFPRVKVEDGIERRGRYLWARMTDEECWRLWDAYNAKVIRMSKPDSSQED